MDQDPRLIRLGLFGSPVAHSLSPVIHEQLAQQAELLIEYRSHETLSGSLAARLSSFAAQGGRGCNVTLPLKSEALQLSQFRSANAERAQSANTLLRDAQGRWHADNTDGIGLLQDLQVNHGLAITGQRIALIGAGGAAAGVLPALLDARPAQLVVFNRTWSRARDLVQRHSPAAHLRVVRSPDEEPDLEFDLVINATSTGHAGQVPALRRSMFPAGAICYDLNYGAAAEPLKEWCRLGKTNYIDGLGMLVEQAIESFRIWTGYEAESAPVIEDLRRELPA